MKHVTATVAWFTVLMVASCGGDKADSGGSNGDAGRRSTRDAGEHSTDEKTLQCGSKICRLPADSIGDPCCRDQFASECGIHVGEGSECRRARADIDKRCPLPDFPGLADAGTDAVSGGLSPCCTTTDECGLDIGLGTGCMSNRGACNFFPGELRDKLPFVTCDGTPLDIPEECTPATSE